MVTPNELFSALAKAYALSRYSSEGGSDLAHAVEEVGRSQMALGWLVARLKEEGFQVGGEDVPADSIELELFHESLEEAGITELRLQGEVEPEVFLDFFSRLNTPVGLRDHPPSAHFRGLEGQIGMSFSLTRTDLPGMVGGIQRLFDSRTEVAPDTREDTDEPVGTYVFPSVDGTGNSPLLEGSLDPGEDAHTAEIPVSAQEEEVRQTLHPLSEVRAYLDAKEPDRWDRESRIRALADELAKAREVGVLTKMVQLLVLPGADGLEDQEALELGRELAGPSVTSHVVARLGSTKDPRERDRLALLLSRLGQEGAVALSDALREARDRSQRRAFMDAMGAMGPYGQVSAQQMVEDPRWFVVRNGVALLGDLGGKDAVAYLTGALANSDPRVRKEAVRSLAKLGGRDAETLVLGMLGDGDPSVRAASCQALGALKSPRSVKPLVDALRDDSLDVQVESLRALGLIGDPGVVRTIEKRALGGLFSKRSKEIRIAAFRALAGIGTPGALRALEKGAKDADPTVRTVARALMDAD